MTAPRVLVCGYYGHGNAGDELILDVLLADVEAELPGAQVTVVSDVPGSVTEQRGLRALAHDDIEGLAAEAAGSDLMVLGGGGLFQDYQGAQAHTLLLPQHWGMSYYAGFCVLGRLVGTPVAVYGIGVGPLASGEGRRLAVMAVEAADAVTVRDEPSKAVLVAAGARPEAIIVSADPVMALPVESRAVHSNTVGVSVRPWNDDRFVDSLARALDRLVEGSGVSIEFVPLQRGGGHDDLAVSEAVIGAMEHGDSAVLAPAEARDALIRRIAGYRALVGMRLHSVILATAAGVPTVAVAYDPKVSHFMQRTGASDRTVAVDDVTPDSLAVRLGSALKEGAGSGRGPLAELQMAAAHNREALARALQVGHRPNSGGSFLVADRLKMEARIIQQQQETERLLTAIEKMEEDYSAWSADYQSILDSRAYRLIQAIWTVTDRMRGRSASGR